MTAKTFWLTGLSGAGKTTLAYALSDSLKANDVQVCVLDGDVLRTGLCRGLGFSAEDRAENIRRVAEVARLMNDAGLNVICALISPRIADRALASQIIGAARFVEVYVATTLAVCEARDVKGLYRKARAGEIPDFTGVSSLYEAPQSPALLLDLGVLDLQEAVVLCWPPFRL